jgi:hypothetical protein
MPVQTQIQVRRSTAATWTSTNPTLAAGELGFETDTGKFKIGTGSSVWTALSYAGGGSQATFNTFQYTATAAQTTFSGVDANGNTLAYTAGSVQVYLNGALLQNTADYAATNGTSVVLTAGALVGDSLTVIALGTFTVSTDIPKSTLTAKGSIVGATAASTPANLSVGANGTVLTADSTEATGLKWVAPASGVTTFTNRKGPTTGALGINGFAYNGSNMYVAVGNSGTLFSSPNAQTWTSRTSGFGSVTITGVVYGNGTFVAYGSNGLISSSTDGITWTARTANVSTNLLYHAVYANSLFVVVGNGASNGTGGITTSPDGITWTKRTVSSTLGVRLTSIAYGNGYFLAGGTYNSNNLTYSTDGITWTATNDTSSNAINFIYYNGSQWLTANDAFSTYQSSVTPPTSGWSSLLDNTLKASVKNFVYDSKIYFANTVVGSGGNSNASYIFGCNPTITNEMITSTTNPILVAGGITDLGANAIYISSVGIIYGDGFGRIYTSF